MKFILETRKRILKGFMTVLLMVIRKTNNGRIIIGSKRLYIYRPSWKM
jgi:hypothetical protein